MAFLIAGDVLTHSRPIRTLEKNANAFFGICHYVALNVCGWNPGDPIKRNLGLSGRSSRLQLGRRRGLGSILTIEKSRGRRYGFLRPESVAFIGVAVPLIP